MRIPYGWLKEYVEIDLTPEALAERLTMAGLEVESVDYPWPNIVTAQILWQERIKGSDHLWATRVNTGHEELSVVCGAPNIKQGDMVPLARVGAKVGDITIAAKKAMGVMSEGMLCSPRELGLSEDHSGIYILPEDTPLGIPLGTLLGDAVIDLDIKAHRGDLSSVVGVAREVATFTGKTLRMPEVTLKEKGMAASKLMKLEVTAPDLCPRYTARVVRGIKIGPSPDWMANRLVAAGMRPINNVVDVTNYVMLELGEPLHAFDYDKVTDHTILVRRAEPGEKLTTLDGVTRTLTPDMLLITDPTGPNVIAGIFGGERVEVSEETTNLILEAAHFSPANVRRTAQAVGLRTEASSRFEKNPDIELTTLAIDRAAQLITQIAGGTVAPGRLDFYPKPIEPRELLFDLAQVPWLTGMEVTPSEAVDALRGLGFDVAEEAGSDGGVLLRLTIPTWRHDVEESADVVEEIARIVGYDRIPSTIPTGPLPEPEHDTWLEREQALREILLGAGLTETLNYPLTSRVQMARLLPGMTSADALTQLGAGLHAGAPLAEPVATYTPLAVRSREEERREIETLASALPALTLHNPLSSEMEALRLTLMPGLLGVVRENSKHVDTGLWFFEIGRSYLPNPPVDGKPSLAQERSTLGVAMTGPLARGWQGPVREADFFALKGVAELLLLHVHAGRWRFSRLTHPTYHPGRAARLEVWVEAVAADGDGSGSTALTAGATGSWVPAGTLGEIAPEVAERFEVSERTYLLELDLQRMLAAAPRQIRHQAIPRYPVAQRDLALVVDAETPAAALADALAASSPLVRNVQLFDVYTGEGIPAGKKSLAYSLLYLSPERTLTEQEIETALKAALDTLRSQFGAELRA